VSRQLLEWGHARDDDARPRIARLERDLERVLEDLSDDFPLLKSLVDRRAGGQKRLPMPGRGRERVPGSLFANASTRLDEPEPEASGSPSSGPSEQQPHGSSSQHPKIPPEEESPTDGEPPATAAGQSAAQILASAETLHTMAGRRRPARYGLMVQFESRPGDSELGRLVDSTIWINDGHPAYSRAVASRALGYHTALSVALALAPLAVETRDEHAFITQFLALWGTTQPAHRVTRRRRARRPA
jgi:hypothetical protein